MYTEFIIIFTGLGAIVVLLLVVIILLIVLLKKANSDVPMNSFVTPMTASPGQFQQTMQAVPNASAANSGVVYCKNCFTEFDAATQFCPKCGTPRS